MKKEHNIDVVVVNGENIAGGRGISRKTLDEIYRAGADIVTSGNHIWDQKEIVSFIDDEPFLIRLRNTFFKLECIAYTNNCFIIGGIVHTVNQFTAIHGINASNTWC